MSKIGKTVYVTNGGPQVNGKFIRKMDANRDLRWESNCTDNSRTIIKMENNVIGHGRRWIIARKSGQKIRALFTADPNVDNPWEVSCWQLNEGYDTTERSPQIHLNEPGSSRAGSVTSSNTSLLSDASTSDSESLPESFARNVSVKTPASPKLETTVAPRLSHQTTVAPRPKERQRISSDIAPISETFTPNGNDDEYNTLKAELELEKAKIKDLDQKNAELQKVNDQLEAKNKGLETNRKTCTSKKCQDEKEKLKNDLQGAKDDIKAIEQDAEFHLENEKAQVEGQREEILELKRKNKELRIKLKNATR